MKMKSLSRRIVTTDDGRYLIKIYDSFLPVFVLDLLRTILSIISLKPQFDFINVETRIKNELIARRKIKNMRMSRIVRCSKNFVIEKVINGIEADEFLKRTKNTGVSYKIGMLVGALHKKNMAIIDNRPRNYIINRNKIFRVDLEMFHTDASEFNKMCDLLSFAESFDDKKIKSAFLRGHARFCDCDYSSYIGFLSKLFLRIIAYIE